MKKVVENCKICCEPKPCFYKSSGILIKATLPFQQLNIDFKGPLPSTSINKYMLTIVDEYSRFPFVYPCKDTKSSTVIKCFNHLFSIFGMPGFIHSDRAPDFLSSQMKDYLNSKNVATSRTSRYNPRGNGQAERYNGTVWKAITLALKSRNLPISNWEIVLPDVLHSIRSLLCTATNSTPHDRMFSFQRKSTNGSSLPSWLSTPGAVYVKNHTRMSKHDPIVEEAELLEANPEYAYVRLKSGHETTVSLRELAPCIKGSNELTDTIQLNQPSISPGFDDIQPLDVQPPDQADAVAESTSTPLGRDHTGRSTRVSVPPQRYGIAFNENNTR